MNSLDYLYNSEKTVLALLCFIIFLLFNVAHSSFLPIISGLLGLSLFMIVIIDCLNSNNWYQYFFCEF